MYRRIALIALLLAGFAPAAPRAGAQSGGPAPAAARSIPEFELRLVDGQVLRSADLAGKVTVIDFWATWCKPCIDEIGDYNRFYRDYRSKVVFVGLATESGSEDDVREAIQEFKIEYPVAAPPSKDVDRFGDIMVFPTTWIIGPDGKLAREILGVPKGKHEQIRSVVDKLLEGGG